MRTGATKTHGWAASIRDDNGETHDLGAGWASEEEARTELEAQGADGYAVYPAVTSDDWKTWEGIEL